MFLLPKGNLKHQLLLSMCLHVTAKKTSGSSAPGISEDHLVCLLGFNI